MTRPILQLSDLFHKGKISKRKLYRTMKRLHEGGGGAETDPIFTASPSHGITNDNITKWNSAPTEAEVEEDIDEGIDEFAEALDTELKKP